MRVVIIGAGAVGGYFGARLQAGGHTVTFLARGARLEALRAHGLHVASPLGDVRHARVDARPAWPTEEPADLTLLAVKSFDTASALALLPPTGAVLTLQNGVENAARLLGAAGPARALGGSCRLEVDAPEPGRIVHTSPFAEVAFGPLGPEGEGAAAAAGRALAVAGLSATRLPDGRTAMWRKAMFLSPFSALTALLDRPWGSIRDRPPALATALAMAREIAAVGTALGVPGLGAEAQGAIAAQLQGAPAAMTSSLHRDLRRGRPTEVDGLYGALLRAAERSGVPAPALATAYALLDVLANPDGGGAA